jgi:undecaprenyl-diphosphatase
MSTENLVPSTVSSVALPLRPEPVTSRCLHCEPPLTPASFLASHPRLRTGLAVAFVLLATAALVRRGAVLLTWDEPIQRSVEAGRTDLASEIFRTISFLGSTKAVLALGCVLAALAWRRCRAVGIVVLVAMLSRPLLEFTLKAIVGRDRPDLERLVAGNGPSFPSGHVMAAIALWGLVPLVVTLYTRDRRIWWASVAGSAALITAIGASRIYLGVHWFSDVVGGLVVGAFFLVGTEWVLTRRHRRDPCTRGCVCSLPAPA